MRHFHKVVMPLWGYYEEIQGGNHDRNQGKPKLLGIKIIFSEPIGFQHLHFLWEWRPSFREICKQRLACVSEGRRVFQSLVVPCCQNTMQVTKAKSCFSWCYTCITAFYLIYFAHQNIYLVKYFNTKFVNKSRNKTPNCLSTKVPNVKLHKERSYPHCTSQCF